MQFTLVPFYKSFCKRAQKLRRSDPYHRVANNTAKTIQPFSICALMNIYFYINFSSVHTWDL